MKPCTQKKRAAIYVRTARPDADACERQAEQLMAYIHDHPEWTSAGVYTDCGASGIGTAHREAFTRMLEACEAGGVDLIVVQSVSRFMRSMADMPPILRKLREMSVDVVFVQENISTLTPCDRNAFIMLDSVIAACESEGR